MTIIVNVIGQAVAEPELEIRLIFCPAVKVLLVVIVVIVSTSPIAEPVKATVIVPMLEPALLATVITLSVEAIAAKATEYTCVTVHAKGMAK